MNLKRFDLAQAFKWSITNVDCLERFWGDVRELELWVNQVGLPLVGYDIFCHCSMITTRVATHEDWQSEVGPHICNKCQQIFVVKVNSSDKEFLEIFVNNNWERMNYESGTDCCFN